MESWKVVESVALALAVLPFTVEAGGREGGRGVSAAGRGPRGAPGVAPVGYEEDARSSLDFAFLIQGVAFSCLSVLTP